MEVLNACVVPVSGSVTLAAELWGSIDPLSPCLSHILLPGVIRNRDSAGSDRRKYPSSLNRHLLERVMS